MIDIIITGGDFKPGLELSHLGPLRRDIKPRRPDIYLRMVAVVGPVTPKFQTVDPDFVLHKPATQRCLGHTNLSLGRFRDLLNRCGDREI